MAMSTIRAAPYSLFTSPTSITPDFAIYRERHITRQRGACGCFMLPVAIEAQKPAFILPSVKAGGRWIRVECA